MSDPPVITEMEEAAPEDKMPSDVVSAYRALTREGNSVALVRLRTSEGGPFHYVLALVEEKSGAGIPLAVIPAGRSMFRFLSSLDKIGPSTDPDFKGVTM